MEKIQKRLNLRVVVHATESKQSDFVNTPANEYNRVDSRFVKEGLSVKQMPFRWTQSRKGKQTKPHSMRDYNIEALDGFGLCAVENEVAWKNWCAKEN